MPRDPVRPGNNRQHQPAPHHPIDRTAGAEQRMACPVIHRRVAGNFADQRRGNTEVEKHQN